MHLFNPLSFLLFGLMPQRAYQKIGPHNILRGPEDRLDYTGEPSKQPRLGCSPATQDQEEEKNNVIV